MDVRTELLRVGAALAVLVVGLGAVRVVRYDGYTVRGENMAPSMVPGDDYLIRTDGRAGLGDVVIARTPDGLRVLARVVGVGGDVLDFVDGRVLRNGAPLEEPYLAADTVTDAPAAGTRAVVPPGTLYLLGDNRGASIDSRVYGPVSRDGVEGAVADAWWWPPAD